METKKRKQMAFDIDPAVHKAIKISAAKRGISMNLWISRAINKRLEEEIKYEE